MTCKNCGAEVSGEYCLFCGAPVVEEAPVVENSYIEEPVALEQPAKNPGKVLGIVSLILGIVSLGMGSICSCLAACLGGFLPMVAGIVGIVLGVIGKNKSKEAGFKNTMATIGIILSVVALVVILGFILVNAILGGLNGLNAASNGYYY